MIKYIKRKDLDISKYNSCIENSIQSNVFGFSWYLDIVADNWDALVLNDYEAVMPIPWRKKFFIKYVYPPFWLIQIGVYSIEVEDENEFLIELFSNFKFVHLKANSNNSFSMFGSYMISKKIQELSLGSDYQLLFSKFRQNRRRDLSKARKFGLLEKWFDSPEKLIALHRANIGFKIKKIKEKDYQNLLQLIEVCKEKKKGEVLSIYTEEDELVASGFFLKHKNKVIRLMSAANTKTRKNGANTFLIDRAIHKYAQHYKIFDFAGSSMKSIAHFNKSFGAEEKNYSVINYNKLPSLIKFFKR